VAITARNSEFMENSKIWVETHFPGIIDDIHFLGTKETYHISKAETCTIL
jgi:hypothetical protein